MGRPLLLDLFCGAGGAARGYARAGFDILGVDINPQPNYPYAMLTMDAMTFRIPRSVRAIHASPPCQAYTTWNNMNRSHQGGAWENENPDLIHEVRRMLLATGRPYVIENVNGAKYHLKNPITLHGGHFGLRLYRPRLFESNVLLPPLPKMRAPLKPAAVYGANDGRRLGLEPRADGTYLHVASYDEACRAMGIEWMEWKELCEAIPPAYTHYVGIHLMKAVLEQS